MKTRFLVILLAVLLLGLGFRLIALNQSFWLDEAINVLAARDLNLRKLLSGYMLGDFHPPLFSLLLWLWFRLVPVSEVTARFPSLFFGSGTVAVIALIGRSLKIGKNSEQTGLIAALLLATSSLHAYYSQEARMYALTAFLATLAFYALLKVCANPSRKHKFLFVVVLLFMLLSDYQPWLLLPVFFLFRPGLTAFATLLTLPWWPTFIHQLERGLMAAQNFPVWREVVGGLSLKSVLLVPIKFLIGRTSVDNTYFYFMAVAPALLVTGFALIRAVRIRNRDMRLILGWLISPFILGLLIAIKIPIFSYFRFLFALPALYLMVAISLSGIRSPVKHFLLGIILLTNLVSLWTYLQMEQFHREDWRGIATFALQGDRNTSLAALPNRAQEAGLVYYSQGKLRIEDRGSLDLNPEISEVFLIRYVGEIFDPENSLSRSLEIAGFKTIEERIFSGGIPVSRYRKEGVQ